MKIAKRELLEKLSQTDLWQNLSAEEVRLYLLLIIRADEIKGAGKLSLEVLEGRLGSNFRRNQLEEAAHDLQSLNLVKINISSSGSGIEFEFLKRG